MITTFLIPFVFLLAQVCSENQEPKGFFGTSESDTESLEQMTDKEVVKIQVYYESLCPGCKEFDASILTDTIRKLGPYLDIHTYPFGNARFLSDGSVECQHGPKECYGNKLHACAIDILKNVTSHVIYNGCMMDGSVHNSGRSDDVAADTCGKLLSVDSEPIKKCAKSSKGEELLVSIGKESLKVGYDGVPWVLINGRRGRTSERLFLIDICTALKHPPKECNNLDTFMAKFFKYE